MRPVAVYRYRAELKICRHLRRRAYPRAISCQEARHIDLRCWVEKINKLYNKPMWERIETLLGEQFGRSNEVGVFLLSGEPQSFRLPGK